MKRSAPMPGGDLEYRVLSAVWELGEASARDLYERIGVPSGLVYTTTAKVLDRLHAKGLVARQRRGKAFFYRARITRDVIDRRRANSMLARLLGAEPRPALAMLVDAVESIDPQLLEELARVVAARRRSRDGS